MKGLTYVYGKARREVEEMLDFVSISCLLFVAGVLCALQEDM